MIEFKPGARQSVGLLIGLAGSSGSGKSFSAMRLAKGICGDKPFAVIDTEARRALHYADQFKFDHAELKPPFRPDAYADAIQAADKAGYPVVVIDSFSHSWAGEGGILDWVEEELQRMAGDDWKKREQCKMASFIRPKCSHKQMVQRLLQVRAHLILCFRAEEKIEMVRNPETKKMEILHKEGPTGLDGWFPVCEKSLPYELTASFLMLATKPGFPRPIKLQAQHRPLFPLDQPITEESGRLIARWAAGETIGGQPQPTTQPPTSGKPSPNPEGIALKRKLWSVCALVHGCAADTKGTDEQVAKFETFLIENCGVGDTEEVKTMTNDRLREIVAKAETEVAKLPK